MVTVLHHHRMMAPGLGWAGPKHWGLPQTPPRLQDKKRSGTNLCTTFFFFFHEMNHSPIGDHSSGSFPLGRERKKKFYAEIVLYIFRVLPNTGHWMCLIFLFICSWNSSLSPEQDWQKTCTGVPYDTWRNELETFLGLYSACHNSTPFSWMACLTCGEYQMYCGVNNIWTRGRLLSCQLKKAFWRYPITLLKYPSH